MHQTKRERELTYRIGSVGRFPYLTVKLNGDYFFISEMPRLDFADMLSAVREVERGNKDFWRRLPVGSDMLAIRIYEMLIWMPEAEIARLGLDDDAVASLGAYSERPENLKAEKIAELASEVVGKCILDEEIVARLDDRFWTRDVAVEDGHITVPLPTHYDPNDRLLMLHDALRG